MRDKVGDWFKDGALDWVLEGLDFEGCAAYLAALGPTPLPQSSVPIKEPNMEKPQ